MTLRPILSLIDVGPRRVAAAGALLFVATFVASVVLAGQPVVHEGQQGIEHSLSGRGLAPALTSLFVSMLGLLALSVALAFLAHALGHRSAGSVLAAKVAWVGGLGYVFVVTVAFSAGAAAAWAQDQGVDLATVLIVNNVRNFAYFAAIPFMSLTALGFGTAAILDAVLTRWIGWAGVGVGVLFLLAVPAAAVGISYAQPVWLLWWIGVGVVLLRSPSATEHVERPARGVVVGHD